ncbi:MAG TPA: hypothetical protein VH054_10280, partial [Polyangiaceae bacterium]|nr:hypothetical protein [Polyangiaceae bacterium]
PRHEMLVRERVVPVLRALFAKQPPTPDKAICVLEHDTGISIGMDDRQVVLDMVREADTTGVGVARLTPFFEECPAGAINLVAILKTGDITFEHLDLAPFRSSN